MSKSQNAWNQNYEQVKSYFKKYGNFPPEETSIGPLAVGMWLQNQRRGYKMISDTSQRSSIRMTKEKLAQMTLIHELWWDQENFNWVRHYNATKTFMDAHSRLPEFNEKNGKLSVGKWLDKQRTTYKSMSSIVSTLKRSHIFSDKRLKMMHRLSTKWYNYSVSRARPVIEEFEQEIDTPNTYTSTSGLSVHPNSTNVQDLRNEFRDLKRSLRLLKKDRQITLREDMKDVLRKATEAKNGAKNAQRLAERAQVLSENAKLGAVTAKAHAMKEAGIARKVIQEAELNSKKALKAITKAEEDSRKAAHAVKNAERLYRQAIADNRSSIKLAQQDAQLARRAAENALTKKPVNVTFDGAFFSKLMYLVVIISLLMGIYLFVTPNDVKAFGIYATVLTTYTIEESKNLYSQALPYIHSAFNSAINLYTSTKTSLDGTLQGFKESGGLYNNTIRIGTKVFSGTENS